MNQILSIENNRDKGKKVRRKSQPIEIHKIIKFFSIVIMIFGIFMVGTGSYSMYTDSQNSQAIIKPTIFVEETSDTQITLKITHNKAL